VNGGNRTRNLLIALVALALYTGWHFLGPSDDAEAPAAGAPAHRTSYDGEGEPAHPSAAAPRGGKAVAPVRDVIPLHMADLVRMPHTYTPGRDPWRFVEPPPPPPLQPRQPSAAELAAMRAAEEARQRLLAQQAAAAAAEAAKPKPPTFTMTYLGSFGPPRKRIAAFQDGPTIVDVQEGEAIGGGRFVVARIGYESVDIRFPGFPDVTPFRLAAGGPGKPPGPPPPPPPQ
jgi:hypothetical protein